MDANIAWQTIPQSAEAAGVSTSTIRRWIARGHLRAYKFGPRAIRIDPADLNGMAEEVNPATFEHVNGGDAL
ncbi:MAG: helix-turn-helix domain-containing protein [Yaniella sp.]|uniref:helix-turn-helix domain-containing protein n=1 Tax=Yaniella sp. TaxID=2773929 RepID=UPI002647DE75|nr:helix-turn-helix domain-containing protein [Yaniella sp.]MDN5731202.1 helix-turn-helix domain-containing protein [Yaniella sp.]MDN5815073.1 helix-turn-helix domain-containing protein [Yaniella sp.]MDN5838942.1 helix-turn-helix domain-containing protein [Yaniella sp.]MDN5911945.1 helix-turn-helix domain-containing protein [Yaniella sp.]MDN6148541.1 helix-turn-helix domain-containing protein [Yaniella sp.]